MLDCWVFILEAAFGSFWNYVKQTQRMRMVFYLFLEKQIICDVPVAVLISFVTLKGDSTTRRYQLATRTTRRLDISPSKGEPISQ